jgi:ATP-dependent exoDNAse (exonuclease V) alpha subunit
MQAQEREIVRRMQAGRDGNVIVDGYTREWAFKQHPHLSMTQKRAVEDVLESRDKMMALEGVAGAGKTTSLVAIRDAVEHHGYEVQGLAPTSRAAQKLAEAGMKTETLQRHLTRGPQAENGPARVYIVDEASMVSTRQMHAFMERLGRHDRVLFVGDVRQHEAVEAGRPYAQMQEAGLRTAHLDEILRQKDPELKQTVEQLARGEVKQAIENLDYQGRVHEFKNRAERFGEMAREYVRSPEGTLVISPDNASRQEINQYIHRSMREAGHVTGTEFRVPVLTARQDMTGADRQHAQNYAEGDVIRYTKGSKPLGIEAGEYARVARVDEASNTVTITRKSGAEVSYDPRRLQGVTVYRGAERDFAQGDRVQMTAPYHAQKLANRELGTVEHIDVRGNLKLKLDTGREVEFNVRQMPHLDYGYAVTSHSSQGQTADRVLVHVDSETAHSQLLNSRMAYVSVSRAQFDVQMYTNDATTLGKVLSREVSQMSAVSQKAITEELAGQKIGPRPAKLEIGPEYGLGLGLSR